MTLFKHRYIGSNLRQATTNGQNWQKRLEIITQVYWNRTSKWILVQRIDFGMVLHRSCVIRLEVSSRLWNWMPWPSSTFSWRRWPRKSAPIRGTPCQAGLILPLRNSQLLIYCENKSPRLRSQLSVQKSWKTELRGSCALRKMVSLHMYPVNIRSPCGWENFFLILGIVWVVVLLLNVTIFNACTVAQHWYAVISYQAYW